MLRDATTIYNTKSCMENSICVAQTQCQGSEGEGAISPESFDLGSEAGSAETGFHLSKKWTRRLLAEQVAREKA